MFTFKPLFKLLIDRSIKEKELAQKAGISPATICKMKKDNSTINANILAKICIALDCKLDDIMQIKRTEERDE